MTTIYELMNMSADHFYLVAAQAVLDGDVELQDRIALALVEKTGLSRRELLQQYSEQLKENLSDR